MTHTSSLSVEEQFKTYLFNYGHEGHVWGLTIQARDAEDARLRVARLAFATYQGEVIAKIPASLGPLTRVVASVQNGCRALLGLWA